MKNPPILVAVLGFFAALAGFGFLFFGLRVLGFDWFTALGDLPAFEGVGLWGWLAVITGVIWLAAALGLWALQPWARLFAMIVAGFAVFEAVLAFFQFPGTGIGLAMGIMPALILWYLSTADVKAAFADEVPEAVQPAPAPPVAPMAFAASTPAPAPVAAVAAVAAVAPEPEPAPVAAPVVDTPAPAAAPVDEARPASQLNVEEVEGIGPAHAGQLNTVGIRTTADLLSAGAKPLGREQIAARTGISEKLVLAWVNKVDLMRIPGVGSEYSDLLEAAGVDSPAELAQRNPANLAVTVQEVVAARPGTVRRIPTEADISAWIDGARALDKVVEH